TGTLLASITFSDETASGWQEVSLPSPVAITANTVYVASYHTNAGNYAYNSAYLTSGFTKSPLYALATGEAGGNGLYLYGAGGFPTQTYNANNYWVDVVFDTATSPPADTTPPTVTAVTPAGGATNVGTNTTVTVTFSEAMDASTINTNTVQLRD